jgi:hypothetical protein
VLRLWEISTLKSCCVGSYLLQRLFGSSRPPAPLILASQSRFHHWIHSLLLSTELLAVPFWKEGNSLIDFTQRYDHGAWVRNKMRCEIYLRQHVLHFKSGEHARAFYLIMENKERYLETMFKRVVLFHNIFIWVSRAWYT